MFAITTTKMARRFNYFVVNFSELLPVVSLSELPWGLSCKLLEKFGEIGRVVREDAGYLGNRFIGLGKHLFRLLNDFEVIKMTGMIPRFFLYGIRQMFVGYEQLACYLVNFHKVAYRTRNDVSNVFIQKLKVSLGNLFASRQYVVVCFAHLNGKVIQRCRLKKVFLR